MAVGHIKRVKIFLSLRSTDCAVIRMIRLTRVAHLHAREGTAPSPQIVCGTRREASGLILAFAWARGT